MPPANAPRDPGSVSAVPALDSLAILEDLYSTMGGSAGTIPDCLTRHPFHPIQRRFRS